MNALLLLPFLPLTLADLPPASEVKPIKVVQVAQYTEGIVLDHEGNAYISHGKVISQIRGLFAEGKPVVREWARTGAPNGHKVLADGTHLVCDASRHAVLHLDASGKILGSASKECDGKPLRGPNDLTLDPRGGFYFTDPGGSGAKNPIGTVHYVDAEGKTHLVAKGLAFPNGIVLRPGGKTLLVGESQHNRVLEYPVLAPGQVGKMRVFANLPEKKGDQIDNQPDGMCLDSAGNLYVAHYGMRQVQVLSPEGKLRRRYPGGNLTTSNVAFAGKNMDQLLVTGALSKEQGSPGALFRLNLKGTKGLVILPPRKEK
jgi:gluconolactonase